MQVPRDPAWTGSCDNVEREIDRGVAREINLPARTPPLFARKGRMMEERIVAGCRADEDER